MKSASEWLDVLANTPSGERKWLIRAIQEDAFDAGARAQMESDMKALDYGAIPVLAPFPGEAKP